jgi:hypothetical protein
MHRRVGAARWVRISALWVVLLGFSESACVPPPEAPAEPSPSAPDMPRASDMKVLTDQQAADQGMSGEDLRIDGADGTDGTKLLQSWLNAARERGATRVGDIALYIARTNEQGLVECRTAFYPEDTVEPHWVPPTTALVSVTKPVTTLVTHYENRCRLVSKPVQRSETTYVQQYDFMTKSSRSVPQTRSVTHYEMQNECRLEPVLRSETHWQLTFEHRYVPPRVDYLAAKRLREAEPVCYAAPSPETASRVEGKIFKKTE